eukprot:1908728-Prymnesium_polylepis.1
MIGRGCDIRVKKVAPWHCGKCEETVVTCRGTKPWQGRAWQIMAVGGFSLIFRRFLMAIAQFFKVAATAM